MLSLRVQDCGRIVAQPLSLCWPKDRVRVLSYVNRATERLLYLAKWKGTVQHYQVCVTNGCITWPRELETIEAVHICGRPGTVRNHYYEFLANGPGTRGSLICTGQQLIDQPESCAFDDVKGTGKKLAVYCDAQESAGTTITLQYYDSGSNFVTSTYNGVLLDGERIALPPAGTYAYSSRQVMANGLVRAYKDETVGVVRLYEFEVLTGLLRPLAYYQRDELVPVYRRSRIPGMGPSTCNTTITNSSCTDMSVVVIGKIRFVPVFDDDDFLVISSQEAIRLGCQAVLREENGKIQEAASADFSTFSRYQRSASTSAVNGS